MSTLTRLLFSEYITKTLGFLFGSALTGAVPVVTPPIRIAIKRVGMVSLDRNKLVREFMIAPFSRWIVTDTCPCVTLPITERSRLEGSAGGRGGTDVVKLRA